MEVTIIQTGTANLASVAVAFERLGAQVTMTRDPAGVRDAKRLVLPGVGTFEAGMDRLKGDDLVEVLAERVDADRPTLGICLGLQLLGVASDESPGVDGLRLITARVQPLDDSAPVPQMGWNKVSANGGRIEDGWAYFANSYAFTTVPPAWTPAMAMHGARSFVAAVERGSLLACQFHPELSGAWGAALLSRWLEGASW